jgi:pyroglutamyl-peptidase
VHNSAVERTRRPPKILLTGFDPFGGEGVNPSLEVARALDGVHIGDAVVVALGLPVSYADAAAGVARAIDMLAPVLVMGLGQAAGAAGLQLERVAVNLSDADQPDNTGAVLHDTPVVAGAPAAYLTTLPLRRLLDSLHRAGFPAGLSSSAGHYVCNHVFFTVLHQLASRGVPGGFIHLPLLPRQAVGRMGAPSLPLDLQVAAVRNALEAARAVP